MKIKNKLQWSAVLAFAGLIAAVAVINRMKGKQVFRARRVLNARRRAYHGRVNPFSRREWDRMSGTSRYSRDFLSGRTMGTHPHLA
jgi:enhancing lycopene biosynthesis protein 2